MTFLRRNWFPIIGVLLLAPLAFFEPHGTFQELGYLVNGLMFGFIAGSRP